VGRVKPVESRLEDDEVRLEPLSVEEHGPAMHELASDDGMALFTRVPDPVPDDFGAGWVQRYVDGWTTRERAGFAILDAASGEFLGFMALVTLDLTALEAEAGYAVASHARGRGVATRALRLLSAWAFDELKLERIELLIGTANVASERVAEQAGYTREGVLRWSYVKPGLRADQAIYGRLRTD